MSISKQNQVWSASVPCMYWKGLVVISHNHDARQFDCGCMLQRATNFTAVSHRPPQSQQITRVPTVLQTYAVAGNHISDGTIAYKIYCDSSAADSILHQTNPSQIHVEILCVTPRAHILALLKHEPHQVASHLISIMDFSRTLIGQ